MTRRPTAPTTDPDAAASPAVGVDAAPRAATTTGRRRPPRTREEVEAWYVEARDAWVAAMHAASSGRPADLAALAIAQEAYEEACAERERWEAGGKVVAVPIESDKPRNLGAIVGQELAWRQVRASQEKPLGILGRIRRAIRGT